jgi:hypothetical protein
MFSSHRATFRLYQFRHCPFVGFRSASAVSHGFLRVGYAVLAKNRGAL